MPWKVLQINVLADTTGLPKQDIQCSATHFQCLRSMVVGNAPLVFGLSCITSIVQQCRLSMVHEGFLQLCRRLTVKKLRRDERLPRN